MHKSSGLFYAVILFLTCSVCTSRAQTVQPASPVDGALKKFPGFNVAQMNRLLLVKTYAIALPTWLPDGFKVEKVIVRVADSIPIDQQELCIVYSKTLKEGKKQRFLLEAGIDGIGDLMFDESMEVNTPLGTVNLFYNPKQDGDPVINYVRTDWLDVDGTAWAYASAEGMRTTYKNEAMISLEETKQIIESLQRL